MKKKVLVVCLILAAIAGVGGAAVSVGLLISAVSFCEWGRVVLYSVTTAVCLEMALLAIGKLRSKESA